MNTDSQKTFWSSVSWPLKEGITLLVVLPIVVGIWGFWYKGFTNEGVDYGMICAAIMIPVCGIGWAIHRVLKAWAEFPSQRRWLSWVKSAVRYLLTDK